MAAPVVESSNSYAWASTTTVTITKPTGLAEGDLMVAYIAAVTSVGGSVDAPSTPTGWTLFSSGNTTGNRLYGYWKEADASDVAASNFSWTVDATDSLSAGYLMRITGQVSGAEIADTSYAVATSPTANPTVAATTETKSNEALLIMAWSFLYTHNSTSETVSNITVNGFTNPTWTEQHSEFSGSGVNEGFVVATATSGVIGTSTSIELDLTLATADDYIGSLTSIPTATSESATPSSVNLSGTVNTTTVVTGSNVTPDSVNISASVSEPTDELINPTIWTKISKS